MTWKIMRIIHIYKSSCIKLKASIKSFFSSLDWRGIRCKDVSQNLPMYFTGVSKCTNTNSSQIRKKNTIHTHEISEYWHKSQTLWITLQSLTSLPCTLQNKWLWLMLETDRQTRKIHLPSILMKILSLYKNTYIMNTCTLLLHLSYNSVYHL